MELTEVELPDGRMVTLIVKLSGGSPPTRTDDGSPLEFAIEKGWLLNAQGRQERELTKDEAQAIEGDDAAYAAVLAVAEELENEAEAADQEHLDALAAEDADEYWSDMEQEHADEEARAEAMDGDHESALESVYGPND